MRPHFKAALICSALAVVSFPAFSQTPTAAPPLTVHCYGTRPTPPLPLRMAPVTGAPYSGDEESYSNPPDNILSHMPATAGSLMEAMTTEVTRVYRDSAGRVRRETSICPGSTDDQKIIDIRDPVTGVQYILDTKTHVARRSVLTVVSPNQTSTNQQNIARLPDGQLLQSSSEQIGTQTIEGLVANGTKVTTPFPADPRNSQGTSTAEVCENWVSPELHILVLKKCSRTGMPMMGEYGVRLTHVSRNEPDPTLFQLPAGFTVVDRAVLGVYVQNLGPTIAKQFGLNPFQGVLVGDVPPDSPAFRAGLKRGDVILKIDNEPVKTTIEFTSQVSQLVPGTTITVEIWRDGKTQDMSATLGGS